MSDRAKDIVNKASDTALQLAAMERMLKIKKARESLLDFIKITMPNPAEPDETMFEVIRHHEIIAAALEELEAGRMVKLIVTLPPRHGKSEMISRRFPAWALGRDPSKNYIFATYNDDFAKDFGRDVREIMRTDIYKEIFPGSAFRTGGAAADRFELAAGGRGVFVGRGGSLTGRGGHILIGDDLIKDATEANSPTIRDQAWDWFTKVFMTRRMNPHAIVIVMTRWHEDDPVGRLTDPTNPCFNEDEAKSWHILDLPFFAVENDPMGRKVGEVLWPTRYDAAFGEAQRRIDPRGFQALYQQQPSPDDGEQFKRDWINYYRPQERPPLDEMRIYGVSDHAVATKQHNDRTCLCVFGVDGDSNIWILDVWWSRGTPDKVVTMMCKMMNEWHPVRWWAEKGHISKSIGPFLRKRMRETETYTVLVEIQPTMDKVQRSGAIQGRFEMGKVKFPRDASWVQPAIEEMMKFPHGRFDDFVDTMSIIGLALGSQLGGQVSKKKDLPEVGTLAYLKMNDKWQREKQRAELNNSLGGW